MKTGTIYKITNTITKKVYIGKTIRDIQMRFKEHIKLAKQNANYKLSKSIRKHGTTVFIIEVVVQNVPDFLLNAFERFWINYYNSYSKGYNETKGGDGTLGVKPWNTN